MYIFPTGRVSNVWDNHAGYGIHGARTGYDLLKSPVCIPPLDQGLSALIEDLSLRGLLAGSTHRSERTSASRVVGILGTNCEGGGGLLSHARMRSENVFTG